MTDTEKPETVTEPEEVTLDVLFAKYPALREEHNARVARAVTNRLGKRAQQAQPTDSDAAAELEAARRRIEELEGATKSETERLIAQRDKAIQNARAVEEAAKAKIAESEARYRRTLVETQIASYAAESKIPGAAHFVRLASEQFAVDDNGRVYYEDEETGKRLDVRQRLDVWRKLPGNEIWSPPAPVGSGARGGTAPRATDSKAWREDPELERRLAEAELKGLPRGREQPRVGPTEDGAQ